MRGITICVGYDDLLEITLVRNMRHLSECLVVSSSTDERTAKVVTSVPGASIYKTDSFYKDGAKFNKGAAMEEGFEVMGRQGRILIWDADILLPDEVPINFTPNCLHSCNRLIVEDPSRWSTNFNWSMARRTTEYTFAGFFQLFNAEDPAIRDVRPWYDVDFTHAGGGDHHFQNHWQWSQKRTLPFNVLHLGPRDNNWFGRASPRVDGTMPDRAAVNEDEMIKLKKLHGWCGYSKQPVDMQEKIR